MTQINCEDNNSNKQKTEFVEYIKKNKKDYYSIFKLYDCQNYKNLYVEFTDFYNKIKNDENILVHEMQKKMIKLKDLFYKIQKSVCLTKHQEICVLTIGVYLSLFLKQKDYCENNNNNNNNNNSDDIKSAQSSENDCADFDDTNFDKINEKLNIAQKQFSMLINILKQLQREYVEKINNFSVSRGDSNVDNVNIDYINKITIIAYKQIESLVTKNNCIFNGNNETYPIKIYSDGGKSTTLCVIDNFKINLLQENKNKIINILMADKHFKITLLKDKIIYFEGTDLLKANMKSLKNILLSLESNKKMINYWLNISKNNNDLCKI